MKLHFFRLQSGRDQILGPPVLVPRAVGHVHLNGAGHSGVREGQLEAAVAVRGDFAFEVRLASGFVAMPDLDGQGQLGIGVFVVAPGDPPHEPVAWDRLDCVFLNNACALGAA